MCVCVWGGGVSVCVCVRACVRARMIEEERTFWISVRGYMNSEIDTTFLLFLYKNLLTGTLYLKTNCLYICSVYKINEKK